MLPHLSEPVLVKIQIRLEIPMKERKVCEHNINLGDTPKQIRI